MLPNINPPNILLRKKTSTPLKVFKAFGHSQTPAVIAVVPGVIPTTILEIYGEMWDGANMNPPYIGPAVTLTGGISASFGAPNGKADLVNITLNSMLTFNSQLNAAADNYIVFTVTIANLLSTYLLVDFRNTALTSYNLVLETGNSVSFGHNGYLYGTAANLGAFPDLSPAENTNDWKIRVWIFEGGAGNLHINGGSSDYNDLWEPTQLGAVGYRRNIIHNPFAGKSQSVAHLSIHKYSSGDTVSRAWANAYGSALAAFYGGLPWSSII
jgi:hypothetical protein